MKNTFKLMLILITVIGFSMAGCDFFDDMLSDGSPEITTKSLPDGKRTVAYSQTLAAKGDKPIKWSFVSGSLPTGLILAQNGAITGTPTVGGKFTFTVKAENDIDSATKQLSITINGINGKWTGPTTRTITKVSEWEAALEDLNGQTGSYTLTIDGSVSVFGYSGYIGSFGTTADGSSLTVTLNAKNASDRLSLRTEGSIIRVGANQTLILDSENLTLTGLADNNAPVVYVDGGTFTMNKGKFSGTTIFGPSLGTSGSGGGVYVYEGTFTMNGGEISGYTAGSSGGGVYVASRGTFTMNNGKISGNTAKEGGGVCVGYDATFTMINGEISGNTASDDSAYGGGVYLSSSGSTFTMINGKISGNTASSTGSVSSGGGVFMNAGTFTMEDGEISGNTNNGGYAWGGGVAVGAPFSSFNPIFIMKKGKISGNSTIATSNSAGGGVFVSVGGIFTMNDGEISGNTASTNSSSFSATGGGVDVSSGTFTMNKGRIFGNTATNSGGSSYGGGVYVTGTDSTVFQIVNGTIYGSNEVDESLKNTATNGGAALYKSNNGTAQRGRFNGAGGAWNSLGNLVTTNDTITVLNGALQ